MTTPLGHQITEKRLVVKQGSALSIQLTFRDSSDALMNVSTFTFSGQIRRKAKDATVAGSFTFDMTNAATGVVLANLSEATSSAMTSGETKESEDSQFWYDMRYINGNNESVYFLEGPFILNRSVTRS